MVTLGRRDDLLERVSDCKKRIYAALNQQKLDIWFIQKVWTKLFKIQCGINDVYFQRRVLAISSYA